VLSLISVAIALRIPGSAPAIAIFVLLFQNLFVSIFSSLISSVADLEFIKGYNFLICTVMWLTAFARFALDHRRHSARLRRLMLQSTGVLCLVFLYFAYGFFSNGTAAAVYLRNIALPIFMFQVTLLTAATYRTRITPVLIAIGMLFILCGYIEATFRDFWLAITNGYSYWDFAEIKATASGIWERQMRMTGAVPVTLKDHFRFSFLNTPLLEGFGPSEVYRVFGPNISAISYAYGVCIFSLFLFSVGRPILGLLAVPLAILCSVKGALIMMLFVSGCWLATRVLGATVTLWAGLLALVAYVAVGLYVGLQIGDYHVIGFFGGWNGLLHAPLGRGLGSGGNFSEEFSSIDWNAAQQAGAVDGAAESAIGVLLYQMGIAGFAVLGLYFLIGLKVWRLYAESGLLTQGLAAFGVFVVLANGVFQEEALFSPTAMALMLCLAGLVIGHVERSQAKAAFPAAESAGQR